MEAREAREAQEAQDARMLEVRTSARTAWDVTTCDNENLRSHCEVTQQSQGETSNPSDQVTPRLSVEATLAYGRVYTDFSNELLDKQAGAAANRKMHPMNVNSCILSGQLFWTVPCHDRVKQYLQYVQIRTWVKFKNARIQESASAQIRQICLGLSSQQIKQIWCIRCDNPTSPDRLTVRDHICLELFRVG